MSNQLLFTIITFNSFVLFLPIAAIILWRRPALWLHLLTLFVGIVIALFDLRASEVQLPAFLLLTFGFFAGFAQPRRAWLWGLMLGVWVPIFGFIALGVGLAPYYPQQQFGSFIAIVPAFIGSYGGALVKRISPQTEQTT